MNEKKKTTTTKAHERNPKLKSYIYIYTLEQIHPVAGLGTMHQSRALPYRKNHIFQSVCPINDSLPFILLLHTHSRRCRTAAAPQPHSSCSHSSHFETLKNAELLRKLQNGLLGGPEWHKCLTLGRTIDSSKVDRSRSWVIGSGLKHMTFRVAIWDEFAKVFLNRMREWWHQNELIA